MYLKNHQECAFKCYKIDKSFPCDKYKKKVESIYMDNFIVVNNKHENLIKAYSISSYDLKDGDKDYKIIGTLMEKPSIGSLKKLYSTLPKIQRFFWL